MLKNAASLAGDSERSAHFISRTSVRSESTVGTVGTSMASAAAKMPSVMSEKPAGQSRKTTS